MISNTCGGRHLNLHKNTSLCYCVMEVSHMAVSSQMVKRWYFRERIRKAKVPVKAHLLSGKYSKDVETEKGGKASDIPTGAIN